MKTSKKLLSLLLAVMMIVTSIPFMAITAAADDVYTAEKNMYLMSYFAGDTAEQQSLRLAASTDGQNFAALNGGKTIVNQTTGTGTSRDHYLFRDPNGNGFYVIATDLAPGVWWNNDRDGSIVIWHTNDFVNWDAEKTFVIKDILGIQAGRAWAPQIAWDATHKNADGSTGAYMIYLAICTWQDLQNINGNTYATGDVADMCAIFTTDLLDSSKYEAPVTMFDVANYPINGTYHQRIDGDIFYDEATSQYVMYYSDYGDGGTRGTDYTLKTYYATSNNIAGPYVGAMDDAHCIYSSHRMEGFTAYKVGNDIYGFADANNDDSDKSTYIFKSNTGSAATNSWSVVANLNNIDGAGTRVRHGSVMAVTAEEYFEILMATGTAATNMKPAYEAYMKAVEYKDSYLYGGANGKTAAEYQAAVNELTAAVKNMQIYTGKFEANAYTTWGNGSSTDAISNQGIEYNNKVLYADASASSSNTPGTTGAVTITTSKVEATLHYAVNVLLYDDDNDRPYFPVMAYLSGSSGNNDRWIYTICPQNSQFGLNNNGTSSGGESSCWHGRGTNVDFGYCIADPNGARFHGAYAGSDCYVKLRSKSGLNGATTNEAAKYYANIAHFTGTLTDSQAVYSENITWFVRSSGTFSDRTDITKGDTKTGNSSRATYVVNYKSIKDNINSKFGTVNKDVTKYYTNVSQMANFFGSVDIATAVNPTAYDWSNVSSAQTSYTTAFNNAINALSTASKATEVDSQAAYDALRTAITKYADVEANPCYTSATWNAYTSALQKAYDAINNVCTANYQLNYNGTSISSIASALESAAKSLVIAHNVKYTSESNGIAQFKCANVASHTTVTADVAAYNAVNALYGTIDTDAYTSALANAKTSFDAVKTTAIPEGTQQTLVDSNVAALITAINGGTNNETRKPYTVTFNVVENGTIVKTDVQPNHYYGDVIDLVYSGSGNVVTWSVAQNGITTYINNQTANYTQKVQCDTTVNVYVTTTLAANIHEVKLLDYFGRAQVAYVPDGTTAAVSGSTIDFSNGITLTNQDCNYISFGGFKIEGGAIIKDSITITEDTVIIAVGSKSDKANSYTVEGGVFELKDGTTTDATAFAVDEVITVKATNASDCVGIAIRTDSGLTMLSYDSTYTFYGFPVAKAFDANGVQLVAVTKAMAQANNITSGIPQSYAVGVFNPANNKISMYCMMTTKLSSDVTIIERGVIASTSATTNETLVKGGAGVNTLRSSSDVNSSMYMISYGTSGKPVYTRSYVAYQATVTVDGITATVPLVAYGDIILTTSC